MKYLIIFALLFIYDSSFAQLWESTSFGTGTNNEQIISYADTVIASGAGGLFISIDDGESWEDVSVSLPQTNPWVQGVTWLGGKLFAAVLYEGVYRSEDFGQTWELFGSNISDNDAFEQVIGFNDEYIIMEAEGDLYISNIEEENWSIFYNLPFGFPLYDMTAQGSEIFLGGRGIMYSANGGNSWNELNEGLPIRPDGLYYKTLSIAVNYETGLFCTLKDKGIFKYNFDEGKWEEKNNNVDLGIGDFDFYGLALNGDNVSFGIDDGPGDVYLSTDGGENFMNIAIDEYIPIKEIAITPGNIFVVNGTVKKRANNGLYNYVEPVSTNEISVKNNFICKIFPNPSSTGIFQVFMEKKQNLTIEVYDIFGRKISTIHNDFENTKIVDLSNGSTGFYIVNFYENGILVSSNKLIKS